MDCQLKLLQYVQNSAVSVINQVKKSEHFIPLLYILHSLPFSVRIQNKIILLSFKCLHGLDSHYLSELLYYYSSSCLLYLAVRLKSMSGRSFSVVALKLWNSFPPTLHDTFNISSFKTFLKVFPAFFWLMFCCETSGYLCCASWFCC